jgi:hypothetical protein
MKSLFLLTILFLGLLSLQSCGSNEAMVSNETTGTIKGTVIDTSGVPVDKALISSTPPSSQLLTSSDGSFSLPDLAPGVYTVLAEKQTVGSGQGTVNVSAGKTTTATIILTPGPITTGVISGVVLDAANAPVSGATITTVAPTKGAITDSTGHFILTGIAQGTYSIIARKDGYDDGSKTVTVTAGLTSTTTIKLGVLGAMPTEGLLAYYKFDNDGSDASGNNRALTITNGVFVSSRSGTNECLSFMAGAMAITPHDAALNPAAITVSLWIKMTKPAMGIDVIKKYAGAGMLNGYTLWFNGPDMVAWDYGANSTNYVVAFTNSSIITDNTWHSIICTADNTGAKLFIDGASIATGTWQGTPGAPNHIQDLKIGDEAGNLKGAIDDIRIYNRVLSSKEIQDLSNEK